MAELAALSCPAAEAPRAHPPVSVVIAAENLEVVFAGGAHGWGWLDPTAWDKAFTKS